MSTINRTPVSFVQVASLSEEVEKMNGRIVSKAYEYFVEGGCVDGHDVDDWVRAEKELLVKPPVELRRENGDFLVELTLPGVDPRDLLIRLTTREMLVASIPAGGREVFRIVHFPDPIDAEGIDADFANDKLRVIIPVAGEAEVRSLGTVA